MQQTARKAEDSAASVGPFPARPTTNLAGPLRAFLFLATRRPPRNHVYVAALLIAAGAALHLPSLTSGFLIDDNLHQYMLRESDADRHGSWRDLFDFGPRGSLADAANDWHLQIWWADPAFYARFLRPVTSLTLRLDYRLFGAWAPGYHVTSLVVFMAFLGLVYRLFLQLDLPPSAALWALAVAALHQTYTLPVEWIANRNTLLAAFFIVATLLCAIGWRRTQRPRWVWLTSGSFLLALGAKESGVVALPLVVLVLLCNGLDAPGFRRAAVARILHDPLVWVLVGLASAWMTFYVVGGFGAHSALYPMPWTDPVGCLGRFAMLVPAALGSLFFCLPLDLVAAWPHSAAWFAGASLAGFALAARAFLRVVPHRRLAGLALGWIVICLIVEAGGEMSDRLMMNASIGAAVLLGLFFDGFRETRAHRLRLDHVQHESGVMPVTPLVLPTREDLLNPQSSRICTPCQPESLSPFRVRPKTPLPLWGRGQSEGILGCTLRGRGLGEAVLIYAIAAFLFFANLMAAVPVNLFRGYAFTIVGAKSQQLLLNAEIDRSAPPRRDVFLLNMPTSLLLIDCGPTWSLHYNDRETFFYPLQAGRRGLVWIRTGDRTMTLTAQGAPFMDHRLERLFRWRDAPKPGDTFRTRAFRATALTVDGIGVRTVHFEFDKPLDDSSYCFLRFEDGRLRRVAPPPLGGTLELAELNSPSALVP